MDTSKQYIKMLEKAWEIQSQKPGSSQGEFVYCEGEVYQEMDDRPLTPFLWLPRQDQLQKMVGEHNLWAKTLAFEFFLRKEGKYDINEYPFQFTSMEQLWLAFVMKGKYNKVWNGKDWEVQ